MKSEGHRKKRNHTFWIVLAIFVRVVLLPGVVVAGIFWLWPVILSNEPRTDTPGYIAAIKDSSADIYVAKNKGGNLQDAQKEAIFGQGAVSADLPSSVLSYAIAVYNWGKKVQEAAAAGNLSGLPENPDLAQMTLSTKDASDAYDDSLDNIDRLKTFGDYAIAKNDKDKMLWVAARLNAEEIFLAELDNSSVSTFAANQNIANAATFGSSCYYGRGHILVISNRSQRSACIKKLNEGIKPLKTAAQNYYTTGKADDAKNWQVAWGALQTLGYPISNTGATVGDPNFQTPPPLILAFQDACKGKGGTTPSGGTKDRLPTTESGQTCSFKGPKGGTCWDFQTDSGAFYSGGDGDCPARGLLPVNTYQPNPQPTPSASEDKPKPTPAKKAEPSPSPAPTANQFPFDGSYSTTPSVACSTPDSSTTLNSDIRGFMSSFTVQQGKIFYSSWYVNGVANPPSNPTIDANGDVSTSYTDDNPNAVEHTEYSAHFDASGAVSGNLSGYWFFTGGSQVNCSGTFSGSRTNK